MKLIDGVIELCKRLSMQFWKVSENTYTLSGMYGTFTVWENNGVAYWKEGAISQAPEKVINRVA